MYKTLSTERATSNIRIAGACDFALLRTRYYNPTIGQFTSFDDFEAPISDPISMHKYNYGNGDPVNNIDPSGKFSVTQMVVTGGIIGGVIGFSYGGIKAARETGQWFSSKTLYYGLMYGAVGFGIGALAGYGLSLFFGVGTSGLTSGVGSQLPTLYTKLGTQLGPLIQGQLAQQGSKTAVSFLLGVAAGVGTGLYLEEPSYERFNESMIAPATFGGTLAVDVILRSILVNGLRLRPSQLTFTLGSTRFGLFGALAEVNAFVLGFTTGYYPTVAIREAL